MSLIIKRRAGRLGSVGASLALVAGALFVASPAQAAVGIELTASDTTVAPGDDVTLSWDATEAVSVEASGEWSGSRDLSGSEDVTPDTLGDHVYTLTATDAEGDEAVDSVTITVTNDPIVPAAVTFPDECTVIVPETANVTYYVDYGDDDVEELGSGTYDGVYFYLGGDSVRFFAEANDGFELDDDAASEWEYTAGDDCLDSGVELVTTDVSCSTVDFTNVSDLDLQVAYGGFIEEEADGFFTLAPGASYSVSTDHAELIYIAVTTEDEELVQIDFLDVPQSCEVDDDDAANGGVSHPTVAPAAGL